MGPDFASTHVLPRSVLPHCVHIGGEAENGGEWSPRSEPFALLLFLSLAKVQDQNENLRVERQLISRAYTGAEAKLYIFLNAQRKASF